MSEEHSVRCAQEASCQQWRCSTCSFRATEATSFQLHLATHQLMDQANDISFVTSCRLKCTSTPNSHRKALSSIGNSCQSSDGNLNEASLNLTDIVRFDSGSSESESSVQALGESPLWCNPSAPEGYESPSPITSPFLHHAVSWCSTPPLNMSANTEYISRAGSVGSCNWTTTTLPSPSTGHHESMADTLYCSELLSSSSDVANYTSLFMRRCNNSNSSLIPIDSSRESSPTTRTSCITDAPARINCFRSRRTSGPYILSAKRRLTLE